ncbi:MAG: glycosyltransferase family 4 protein [Planctomycetia bacterium]|nr:glycosyltransferase family 4 protein [Planctomycetia bacterium]
MHITALVESAEHVCCRYRLTAFRPFLERAGHTLELRSWPRAWWDRLTLGRKGGLGDAVIIQRKLLPYWQLYLLRRAARWLLFDFDDAVFLRDSYAAKGSFSGQRQHRFAATVRAADVIVAGNDFLAEHATRSTTARRVRVVPTCVEPERYPPAEHHRQTDVQLVWVGSSSTLRGLEAVQPLLESIGQRCPSVRLKLVCDRFLQLERLLVLACPWSEATEAAEIAAADIGISWVPDDGWSRGKCGLKVLQYMAAGLPVVANPVGVQADMVRHGETGFLAETAHQWAEAIALLASQPELRRSMGAAGRQRVERDFSVAHGAGRWLALLDDLQQRRMAA